MSLSTEMGKLRTARGKGDMFTMRRLRHPGWSPTNLSYALERSRLGMRVRAHQSNGRLKSMGMGEVAQGVHRDRWEERSFKLKPGLCRI